MPSSAPPVTDHSSVRSPFAGPGECGWRLWRSGREVVLAGVLVWPLWQADEMVSYLGPRGGAPGVGLVAVAVVLMLVRRRFPATAVVGLAALMGAVPVVALLTATAAYTVARQVETPRRRAELLLAAGAATLVTSVAFAPWLGLSRWVVGPALGAVLATTTIVVPGLVGTSVGQQNRLLRALRGRAAAAEQARRLAESESRMRERSRIAAEMHDLVGHRLSLVSLHAGGLEMALLKQAPGLREEAALVRRATRDAMQELREALGVLGPLEDDTGTGALTDATGTRADIEALVEESRGGGIPVTSSWEGPDLDARPARVRRAVQRVVRESLTNVHRYAAGAHVTVAVRHTGAGVEVQVRNGVPPTPPAAATGLGSGQGLTGLRERVALLGGTLKADRTPGGGFVVTADIPADPGPGAETADAAPETNGPVADEESGSGLSALQRRVGGVVAGLLGLVGVGVGVMSGLVLVDQAQHGSVPSGHEVPRLGMSRERVESVVGSDTAEVRAAAAGHEPPRPDSATECVYPYPLAEPHGGRLELVRYCFRSGTLIAVDRFTVPVVTEKPTGESKAAGESEATRDGRASEPPRRSRTHD
ncbi:sensor histidine kinase [Streptomyces tubercidicus]|uniref:sensor histidine kinase n=1 Tax=Streptomyces tubercidicus TaxID=47759 RepID=UPI00135BEC42|nr:histidine kinase [Streptomyces tubercidicus]WAU13235.1 histidine kinase [Streptomyces tubercidicus]